MKSIFYVALFSLVFGLRAQLARDQLSKDSDGPSTPPEHAFLARAEDSGPTGLQTPQGSHSLLSVTNDIQRIEATPAWSRPNTLQLIADSEATGGGIFLRRRGQEEVKKKKKKQEEAQRKAEAEKQQQLLSEGKFPKEDAPAPAQPPQSYQQIFAEPEPEHGAKESLERKFYHLLVAEAKKEKQTVTLGPTYALLEKNRNTARCALVIGDVREQPGVGLTWASVHAHHPKAEQQHWSGLGGAVAQDPFALPTERETKRYIRTFRFLGPTSIHHIAHKQAFLQAGEDAFKNVYLRNRRNPMKDQPELINEWYRLLQRGDSEEAERRREKKAAPYRFSNLKIG